MHEALTGAAACESKGMNASSFFDRADDDSEESLCRLEAWKEWGIPVLKLRILRAGRDAMLVAAILIPATSRKKVVTICREQEEHCMILG